jgi:hypothetical protein
MKDYLDGINILGVWNVRCSYELVKSNYLLITLWCD